MRKDSTLRIKTESDLWLCRIEPSIYTHYFVFGLFLATSTLIWGFVFHQIFNTKWMLDTFQKVEFIELILYWFAGGSLSQAIILKEYQQLKKQFLYSDVFEYQNYQSVFQPTETLEENPSINQINQPKMELILNNETQLTYNNSCWQIKRKMFFPFGLILHLTTLDNSVVEKKILWLAKDQFSRADWRTLHFHLRQSRHPF